MADFCQPNSFLDVLSKIHAGDESLVNLIPPQIFDVIKSKKLFGWQKSATLAKN